MALNHCTELLLIPLANIGDAMITDRQASFQSDLESVANLIIRLGHPQRLTSNDQNEDQQQSPGPYLSIYAGHFIQQVGSASYSYIFEVRDLPK